nr:MAG TPA: hypothetical protein [Caudoviricetes sp.]DAP82256.1 MAG TPA: hypothetical protein [Caudoviricetes sp.]
MNKEKTAKVRSFFVIEITEFKTNYDNVKI